MADALHDLRCPVPDRVLVLNVLRGLNDTYGHLRTWITRQWPFPSFLQVRDDLVLEEITKGPMTGSSSSPGSSTALVATPSSSSAPPATSLLGAPPPEPSGGGGRGGRRREGGHGGGGGGTGRRSTPTPPAPAGVPWPSINNPWSGHISMWPFQCPGGLLLLSTSQRPCSRAPLLRSCRPGLHPLSPARLSPGLADGTRLLWHSPSVPWGRHRPSVPTGSLTWGLRSTPRLMLVFFLLSDPPSFLPLFYHGW